MLQVSENLRTLLDPFDRKGKLNLTVDYAGEYALGLHNISK